MTSRPNGFSLMELLIVVALTGVISAIAVPMMRNSLGDFRLRGDARSLTNAMSLTKMRAASDFTQSRLYVDTNGLSFQVQTWNKTSASWVTEGGLTYLSQNDTFSFGSTGTPPPNSQGAIGQPTACRTDLNVAIANTACVLFNSRGIPVDSTGAPTSNDVVYVTDSTAVYGIAISATGLVTQWRTTAGATPSWTRQ